MEYGFSDLAGCLPPVIARKKVDFYFGGLVSPKTLANADCDGEGPRVRIRVGREIAYPTPVLLEWLESRSEVITKEK